MHVHGGTVDIAIQDQTSDRISLFLGATLGDIILLTTAVKDSASFNITTDGTVPVVGNFILIQEDKKVTQEEILTVVAVAGAEYTISIAIPLDVTYSTTASASLQNVDMNINGATTATTFSATPETGTAWDINRMIISMTHGTAGDDGLYGNLTKLTNGVYYRKEGTTSAQSLYNVRENAEYRVEGYDVTYPTRSGGGGTFGTASRVTFNGQDKAGVAIRVNGTLAESFSGRVRDNISALTTHRVKIQGHVVVD